MINSTLNFKIAISSSDVELEFLNETLGVMPTKYFLKGTRRTSGGLHKENVWIYSSGHMEVNSFSDELILLIRNNILLFQSLKNRGCYLGFEVNMRVREDQIGFSLNSDDLALLADAGFLLDVDCSD